MSVLFDAYRNKYLDYTVSSNRPAGAKAFQANSSTSNVGNVGAIGAIGGRLLITKNTLLGLELLDTDTQMYFRDNVLVYNDVVYLEKDGYYEYIHIDDAPYQDPDSGLWTCGISRYATEPRIWAKDDILCNLGNDNTTSFIDIYTDDSILHNSSGTPAIDFHLRNTGYSWDDFSPRVCIGNLKNKYDYTDVAYGLACGDYTQAWLSIDDDNGVRINKGNDPVFNINTSGNILIHQNVDNDNLIELKSSVIDHGMTASYETDTYGIIKKVNYDDGGLLLTGLTETTTGISLTSYITTANTSKDNSAIGAINMVCLEKSSDDGGPMETDANLLVLKYSTDKVAFIFDSSGNGWQSSPGAWTNFDDHDDITLLTDLSLAVSRDNDPIKSRFQDFLKYNKEHLIKHKLISPDASMVNHSRLNMLLVGALRQLGDKVEALENSIKNIKLLSPIM